MEEDADNFQDLTWLLDSSNEKVSKTLIQRYKNDSMYTNVGPVLIAMNPFKNIAGLYNEAKIVEYFDKKIGFEDNIVRLLDRDSHIFAITSQAYINLCRGRDQSLIISGESGAGKTETTKHALSFLTNVGGTTDVAIKDQLLEFSHILESWGNAKTVRNNNSSRFGKFTEIWFRKLKKSAIELASSSADDVNQPQLEELFFISGAKNTTYLLEKSRVVAHDPAERTFHVFYQYFKGAGSMHKKHGLEGVVRNIGNAKIFSCNGIQDCLTIPNVNDASDFNQMINSMKILSFSEESINSCFDIIASIIHLMELDFESKVNATSNMEECSVTDVTKVHLQHVSDILNIKVEELKKGLLFRSVVSGKDTILSPLSLAVSLETRDTLCKDLYLKTFDFIVKTINQTLDSINQISGSKADSRMLGVLDIFGFEIFEKNSFEQLCINMANETLQQNFNTNIFKRELELYIAEDIPIPHLDIRDNQDVLDLLIKKPTGIYHLLDEEGIIPKGTDESFLNKLVKNHGSKENLHPKFALKSVGKSFMVRHFAGDVVYNVTNMLNKNRDAFPGLLNDVLSVSGHTLLKRFYGPDSDSLSASSKGPTSPSTQAAPKKTSLGKKFQLDLDGLMAKIESTQPHFVRCIKPNDEKVAKKVKDSLVYEQLVYSGVFEAVVIMRSGYPCKLSVKQFRDKFHMLSWKNINGNSKKPLVLGDDKLNLLYPERLNKKLKPSQRVSATTDTWRASSQCLIGLLLANPGLNLEFIEDKESIIVGQSIVFYRPAQQHELERMRLVCRKQAITFIQRQWRGYKTRKLLKTAQFNFDEAEKSIAKRDIVLLSKQSNNVEVSVSKLRDLFGVSFAEPERKVLVSMSASLNNEKLWEAKMNESIGSISEINMATKIEGLYLLRDSMTKELSVSFKFRGKNVNIFWNENPILKGAFDKIDKINEVVLLKAKFEAAISASDEITVENLLAGFDRIVGASERLLTTDFKNRSIKFLETAANTFSDFLSLVEEPGVGKQNVFTISSNSKVFSGTKSLLLTGDAEPLQEALMGWDESLETVSRSSVRSTKAIYIFSYVLHLRNAVIAKDYACCWNLLHLDIELFNAKVSSSKQVSQLITKALSSFSTPIDNYNEIFNLDVESANAKVFYQAISDLNYLPPSIKRSIEYEVQSFRRICLYKLIADKLLDIINNETLPDVVAVGFESECNFKSLEFLLKRLEAYNVGWDLGSSESATYDDILIQDVYTLAKEHLLIRKSVFNQDFENLQAILRSLKKITHDHADFQNAYSFAVFNLLRQDMMDVFNNDKDGNSFEEILRKYTTVVCCDAEWKKNVKCIEMVLPVRYFIAQKMYKEAEDYFGKREAEFLMLEKEYQLLNTINISKKIGFIKGGFDLFEASSREVQKMKKVIKHELALILLAAAFSEGQITGSPGNINFSKISIVKLEDTLKKVEHDIFIQEGDDGSDAASAFALLNSIKDLLKLRNLLISLQIGVSNDWVAIKEFIFLSNRKYSTSFQKCHSLCRNEFLLIYDEIVEMDIQTDLRDAISSSPLLLEERNAYKAFCDIDNLHKLMEQIEEIEKRKSFSSKLRSIVFTGKLIFALRYTVLRSQWEGVSAINSISEVDPLQKDLFGFVSQPLHSVFDNFTTRNIANSLFNADGDRRIKYLADLLKLFERLDAFEAEKQSACKSLFFVGLDKMNPPVGPIDFVKSSHVYDVLHFYTNMQTLAPLNIAKALLDDTVSDIVHKEFEMVKNHCQLRKAYLYLLLSSCLNQVVGTLACPDMKLVNISNLQKAIDNAKKIKFGVPSSEGGIASSSAKDDKDSGDTAVCNYYWNLPLWIEGASLISNLRNVFMRCHIDLNGVESQVGSENSWLNEVNKVITQSVLESTILKLESCPAFPLLELKFIAAKICDLALAEELYGTISEYSKVVISDRKFDSKVLSASLVSFKDKHSKWSKKVKLETFNDNTIFSDKTSCCMSMVNIVESLVVILDLIQRENENRDDIEGKQDNVKEFMSTLNTLISTHGSRYVPSTDHLIFFRRVSGEIFRIRLVKQIWRATQQSCVQGSVMQLDFPRTADRIAEVAQIVDGFTDWTRDFTDAGNKGDVDIVTETAIQLSKSFLNFLNRIQALNVIFSRSIDTNLFSVRKDNSYYDRSTGKDMTIMDILDLPKIFKTALVTVSSFSVARAYRTLLEDWKIINEIYLEVKSQITILQSSYFKSESIPAYLNLVGLEKCSRLFVVESIDFLTDYLYKPSSNTSVKSILFVYNRLLENSESCRLNAKKASDIVLRFWSSLKEFGNSSAFKFSNFVSSMLFSMIFLQKILLAKCNGWIEQFDRNWTKVPTSDFSLFDLNNLEFSDKGISTLTGLASLEDSLLNKKLSFQACLRDFIKIFNSNNNISNNESAISRNKKHLFISHPLVNLFASSCFYFIEDEVTNLELNRVILNDDISGSVGQLRFTPLVNIANTKYNLQVLSSLRQSRNIYNSDQISFPTILNASNEASTALNSSKVTFEIAMKRCDLIGYLKPDLKLLVESVDISLQLRKFVFYKKYEDGFYCLKDFLISNKFLARSDAYDITVLGAHVQAKEKLFMDVVLCLLNKDYFFVIRSLYKDFISLSTEICDGFWRMIIFDSVLTEAVSGNRIKLKFPLFYFEDPIVIASSSMMRCLNRMKNISKHSYGLQTILTHLYDLRRSAFACFCKIEKIYKLCNAENSDDDSEVGEDNDSNDNSDSESKVSLEEEERQKLWLTIADEIQALKQEYREINSLTDITNEVVEENCDTEDMMLIKKHVLSEIKLIRDYISFHFVSFDLELMMTGPMLSIRKADGLVQYFVPKLQLENTISTALSLNYNKFGDDREQQMLFFCKLMGMLLEIIVSVSPEVSKKKYRRDNEELIFGLNAVKYTDLEQKIKNCSTIIVENAEFFNDFHDSSFHFKATMQAMAIACTELRQQAAMVNWLCNTELFIEDYRILSKAKPAQQSKSATKSVLNSSFYDNNNDDIYDGYPIVLKRKVDANNSTETVTRVHDKSVEMFLKISQENFKNMKVITEVGMDIKAWVLLEIDVITQTAIKENWSSLKAFDGKIASNPFFNRDISSLPFLYRHMNSIEYIRTMKQFILSFSWNIPLLTGWSANKALTDEINNELIANQESNLQVAKNYYNKSTSRQFPHGPSASNAAATGAAANLAYNGSTIEATYDKLIGSTVDVLSSICNKLKEIVTSVKNGNLFRAPGEEIDDADGYSSKELYTDELCTQLKGLVNSSKSRLSDDFMKVIFEVLDRYMNEIQFRRCELRCNNIFHSIRLQFLDENVVLSKSAHIGIYEIIDTLRANPAFLKSTLPMLQLQQDANMLSYILNLFSKRKFDDDGDDDDVDGHLDLDNLTESLYILNIAVSKCTFDEKIIFMDMRCEFEGSTLYIYNNTNKVSEGTKKDDKATSLISISDQDWRYLTSSTSSEAENTSTSWKEVIINTDSYAEIPTSEPTEESNFYVYFRGRDTLLEEFVMSRSMLTTMQAMGFSVNNKEDLLKRILPIRSEDLLGELAMLEKFVVNRHFKKLFYDLLRSSNMSNARSSQQFGPLLTSLKTKYSKFEEIDSLDYSEEALIQLLLHYYVAQRKPFYWRKDLLDNFAANALKHRLASRNYSDALKKYKRDYENRQQNKVDAEKCKDFNFDEHQLTRKLEVEAKISKSFDKLSQFYELSKKNSNPKSNIHELVQELTATGLPRSLKPADGKMAPAFSAQEFFDSALSSSKSDRSRDMGNTRNTGNKDMLRSAELIHSPHIKLFDESAEVRSIVNSPYKNKSYEFNKFGIGTEYKEDKTKSIHDSMSPSKKLEYLASHGSSLPNKALMVDIQRANSEDIARVQTKLSIISSPLFNTGSANSQPSSQHHSNQPPTPPFHSSTASPASAPIDQWQLPQQQRYHSSGVNVAAALFGSPLAKFSSSDKERNGKKKQNSGK